MKNILKLLFLSAFLTACGEPPIEWNKFYSRELLALKKQYLNLKYKKTGVKGFSKKITFYLEDIKKLKNLNANNFTIGACVRQYGRGAYSLRS